MVNSDRLDKEKLDADGHTDTNNADKEGTTAVDSSKLCHPVRNPTRKDRWIQKLRMAINGMVKRLCKEEDVGYFCGIALWGKRKCT